MNKTLSLHIKFWFYLILTMGYTLLIIYPIWLIFRVFMYLGVFFTYLWEYTYSYYIANFFWKAGISWLHDKTENVSKAFEEWENKKRGKDENK